MDKIISVKNIGFRITVFLLVTVLPSFKSQGQDNSNLKKIVKQEKKSRETIVLEAQELKEEASSLIAQNKFFEASKKCLAAKEKLQSITGPYAKLKLKQLDKFIEKLKVSWADKFVKDARLAFMQKKYEDAILLSTSAAKINPAIEKDMEAFVKQCQNYINTDKFNEETKLSNIDHENKIRKEDINLLLQEVKVFYKNQLYDRARENLEKILLRDPYNEQAVNWLDKIYRKIYHSGTKRRYDEVLDRESEVQWTWNQGVLPTDAIKPKPTGPKIKQASKTGIYEKLQKIIFDYIDFDDASITSVVTQLRERSVELDPDGKGVNLLLQLSPQLTEAVPRVTMSFDQIPMAEVIRYLCQGSGLKYRIEEKAVLIGDKDIDEMETRFFQVRAELVANIVAPEGGGAEGGEEGGDAITTGDDVFSTEDTFKEGGAATASSKKTASSAALKQYFSERGVPFDENATIAYDRRTGRLIVKNTPENLRKLEELLRDLDITKPMVLIEAKILEITQTDLEELGFDWAFNFMPKADPRWTVNNIGDPNNLDDDTVADKVLRHFQSVTDMNSTSTTNADNPNKLINNLNIIPNMSIGKRNLNVWVTVNAIDRTGRGEVLSAPKVIASSGTTATIRMVREEYYPESWVEPEVSLGDNGSVSYTPTYPEFGDPTDIGIRFEVTPTVASNNYTISLELNPQVVSLAGWTSYNYQIAIGGITVSDATNRALNAQVKMPEVARRDLVTKVKVFDGETVVLGGMIKETNNARNDKWPALGEVPVVGRLFASQFERSQKINLLMFVTTRLMNNDGVPVRANTLRGLPEFQR